MHLGLLELFADFSIKVAVLVYFSMLVEFKKKGGDKDKILHHFKDYQAFFTASFHGSNFYYFIFVCNMFLKMVGII